MPVNDGSDFGQVRFRSRTRPAAEPAKLGFWGIFGAVLLALFVHSLVVGAFTRWELRREVAALERMTDAANEELRGYEALLDEAERRGVFAEPARPARRPPLPAYPGHVTARAQGAPLACISGRVYRRVAGGWTFDGGGACRATSE